MAEKIGEGLQYKAYSSGNRVRKVPKSREEVVSTLEDWHNSDEEIQRLADEAIQRRETAVERLAESDIADEYIFGHLEIHGPEEIYQDKVTPVCELLDEAGSLEEKQEVVDDYIDLLHELWSYGIGDTIYNFTINNGYDSEDRLIQLDFGEIVFSQEIVREAVEERKWLDQWSYSDDISDELGQYFKERMSEEITVGKLEDKWRQNM